jgi:uncharacterized protein (TIGR02596 family)
MVCKLTTRPSLRPLRSFTLVELLAVISIMAIFAAFTLPSFISLVRDFNIGDGGSRTVDALNVARQAAMSRNQTVEVRFYCDANNNNQYDSIVSLIPAGTTTNWLTKPTFLPTSVVFDTNSAFSPLITAAFVTGASVPTPAGTDNSTSTPLSVRGNSYVAFHFRADGSTDLGNATTWCLTVYNPASQPVGTLPANNYVTILLDPVAGRTRIYQPH